MEKEKSAGELLQEKLLLNRKNIGMTADDASEQAAQDFCEPYKAFLDACKMEREAVSWIVNKARAAGYAPFDPKASYRPGDRVYYNNRGKALILTTFGTRPLTDGVRIMASHIDSPRLDLKPNPLYEEAQIAFFKTHYYGGIKSTSGALSRWRCTASSSRRTARRSPAPLVRTTATLCLL